MAAQNVKMTTLLRSKKNKYGVAPKAQRTLNSKVYASKKEKNYRVLLDKLKNATDEKERVIQIEEQVPFNLVVKGVNICKYILDFKVTYADGRVEYVDVKGMKSGAAYQMFKLKKHLMLALFDIDVKEV